MANIKFEKTWKYGDPISPAKSFNYWFDMNRLDTIVIYALDKDKSEELTTAKTQIAMVKLSKFIGNPTNSYDMSDQLSELDAQTRSEIVVDFIGFIAGRPEGALIPTLENITVDRDSWSINTYYTLLASCIALNEDNKLCTSYDVRINRQIDKLIGWLWNHTDIATAPGSTQYHDSYIGGLFNHLLRVAVNAYGLIKSPVYADLDIRVDQLITCTLVHDWCKLNLYTEFKKNVKNDETGNWDQITAFKHNSDIEVPLGHATASMWIANKFFDFTLEQNCAIRWHMGRWHVCDDEKNDLQYANEKYPMVHILQFADQLAITKYLK